MNNFFILVFLFVNFVQLLGQDLYKMAFAEMDSLIDLSYKKGDYLTAMNFTKAAIKNSIEESGNTVYYTQKTGHLYEKLGNYEEAENYYKQAIKYGEEKITVSYVQALSSLANLYTLQNKQKDAESLLKEGLLICKNKKGEETDVYANILENLGGLYKTMGKYDEAIYYNKQTINLRKRIFGTNNRYYAAALNNLAVVYYDLSNYEEAEILYKEALEINKIVLGEQQPEVASSLNNLAILYSVQHKYAQAEPLLMQSLQIYKNILGDQHPTYAVFLNNLAGVYHNQKKYTDAEQLYKQALFIRKITLGPEHPKYASTLNNLAVVYLLTKKFDLAEQLYKEALAVLKKTLGEKHPSYAVSLNDLGTLYKEQKKYVEALKLYEEALSIFKKSMGEQNQNYIQSLQNIGLLYLAQNEYAQAINYHNKVLQILCKDCDSSTTDWSDLPQQEYLLAKFVLSSLSKLYDVKKAQFEDSKDEKDLKAAYHYLEIAIQISEKIRHSLNSEEDKLQVLADLNNQITKAISVGTILNKNGGKLYLNNSFNYAEQNKSILLADAVKGQKASSMGDLPDSLLALEKSLQEKKKALEKASIEAKNDIEIHKVHQLKSNLNLEIEAFIKSIKDKFPKYHALKYENITAKVEDIQALLDEETLLLEYFLGDSSMVYLFAISKKEVQLFPILINAFTLGKQLNQLRNSLSDYKMIIEQPAIAYSSFTSSAHWFYANLLEVALKNKSFKNLLIITDGDLGHIPFETFLVEAAPQVVVNYSKLHYLLKDYNISYNYSATLWKENKLALVRNNNHQLLACSATYSDPDSSLLEQRDAYFFNWRKELEPLPSAIKEVQTLSENFEGKFLFDAASNEGFFKNNASNYGIIHLAMHGILHPRVPMLSSLAFTENQDSLEDNFLQAYEIAHLNLQADLVVLSACETGYGAFQQGEGVMSLARSFMYAGVPSLVVSLWQVNDYCTSAIMELFYENLATGLTKDAALRQAKLDFLSSSEGMLAHPTYWSPFIQLGDNRAIILERKNGNRWFFLIIGLLVVGIVARVYVVRKSKLGTCMK